MLPFLSSGKSTPNLEFPILISWNMQQLRTAPNGAGCHISSLLPDLPRWEIRIHHSSRASKIQLCQSLSGNGNKQKLWDHHWNLVEGGIERQRGIPVLQHPILSHTPFSQKETCNCPHCEAMRSWPKPQELPALEQMYSTCLACIPNETNIDSFDALTSKQSIRSTRNKQSSEKTSPYSLNSTPLLQGHSILSWDPHKGYPSAEW